MLTRFIGAAVFTSVLFIFVATPVFAEDVTEPDIVQGELTENHQGTKVTVGYSTCGTTFQSLDEYGNLVTLWDPLAKYLVTIHKGSSGTTTIWAHSIWRLDLNLNSFGYSLTQEQLDKLAEDVATYICTIG